MNDSGKIISISPDINVRGLVVLSGSKSWMSKLIKWWTGSKFSHVSILLDRTVGDLVLKFEAQERGVIPYLFRVNKNKYVEIWDLNAPQDVIDSHLAKILELTGHRYWFENLLGFAISDVAGFFGVEMENPFNGGYWCSKLGQYFINGVKHKYWLNPNDTTPEEIGKLFNEWPKHFTLKGFSDYGQDNITWLKKGEKKW